MTHYCLHDGEPFDGLSVHIPIDYDGRTYTIDEGKRFCSISCMYTWCLETKQSAWKMTLMKNMCKEVYGTPQLVPAMHRWDLQKYGGKHTIEDFRTYPSKGKTVLTFATNQKALKEQHLVTSTVEDQFRTMPHKPKIKNNLFRLLSKKRKKMEDLDDDDE